MTQRVLVVGDVMMDHYIYVNSVRRAAEADIPVWDAVSNEYRMGGAANVANNLKALGKENIDVHLAGIASRSNHAHPGRDMISAAGIGVMLVGGTRTLYNQRFVSSDDKILFRCDNSRSFSEKESIDYERFFCSFIGFPDDGSDPAADALPLLLRPPDMIIISDYGRGTVTPKIVEKILKLGIPVIVDSKRKDLSIFSGVDVIKLNAQEYALQCTSYPETFCKYLVVTRGDQGAELRFYDHEKSLADRHVVHSEYFPTDKIDPVDITGCGDTYVAGLSFSLLKDPDVRRAMRFANACASTVVKKFGTAVVDVNIANSVL